MILTALILAMQAAPAPSAAAPAAAAKPAPSPVEKLKVIDSVAALDLFKAVCWDAFRNPDAFHAAVTLAPVPLALQPKPEGSDQPGESYKADEALLTYLASDILPRDIPSRQCNLRVRLAGAADQLALAARIQQALALPSGRTRTRASQSQTEWDVPGPDARVARLFAITRAAPGGTTELRLSALLLAQK